MPRQAQTAAKADEISAEYQAHVDRCIARHEPTTIDEQLLVQAMADALWSIHQIRAIRDPVPTDTDRYEKSMEIYFRTYGELRDVRREEDREIRELHRMQAADFSAYIRSRAR